MHSQMDQMDGRIDGKLKFTQQECIPVGCVPPALYHTVRDVSLQEGFCLWSHVPSGEISLTQTPRQRPPGQRHSPQTETPPDRDPRRTEDPPEETWDQAARQEVTSCRDTPPFPVNRMTDRQV